MGVLAYPSLALTFRGLCFPLICCFDNERRCTGYLVRCPQQHTLRHLLGHCETCRLERIYDYIHVIFNRRFHRLRENTCNVGVQHTADWPT